MYQNACYIANIILIRNNMHAAWKYKIIDMNSKAVYIHGFRGKSNVSGVKYYILWKLMQGNLRQSTSFALTYINCLLGESFYESMEFLPKSIICFKEQSSDSKNIEQARSSSPISPTEGQEKDSMVLPINVPRYSKGKMSSWYSLEVGSVMCPLFTMLPINRISVMRFTNSYFVSPE